MSATASPDPPHDLPADPIDLREARASMSEERWAAWQARGVAHDRAVQRRMMFALPILGVVGVGIYILLALRG